MDFIDFKNLNQLREEFSEQFHLDLMKKGRVYSGFQDLDAIVNGFQMPSLNYIVSVVNMGKSTLVDSLVLKMTDENKYPALFFSLEHDANTLMTKVVSCQTHIACKKIQKATLSTDEKETITSKLKENIDFPLYVVDSSCLTVSDIEQVLFSFPPDVIKIIVIDSILFLNKNKKDIIGNKNTKKDIEQILRGLKGIAMAFNVALFVTLPVAIDLKESKRHSNSYRPNLKHLNQYGAIAKIADSILFMYRPTYYKIEEWDDEIGSIAKNELEITIATNTFGTVGNCKLYFNEVNEMYESIKQ